MKATRTDRFTALIFASVMACCLSVSCNRQNPSSTDDAIAAAVRHIKSKGIGLDSWLGFKSINSAEKISLGAYDIKAEFEDRPGAGAQFQFYQLWFQSVRIAKTAVDNGKSGLSHVALFNYMFVAVSTVQGRSTGGTVTGSLYAIFDDQKKQWEFSNYPPNLARSQRVSDFVFSEADKNYAKDYALRHQKTDTASSNSSSSNSSPSQPARPKKTPVENLRLLSAAADQYFLENGVSVATYDQLVGPGLYIKEVIPAEGEVYRTLSIQQGKPLVVASPSGKTFRYDP